MRETKVGIVIRKRETESDATGEMWARGIALCARETGDAACVRERKPGGPVASRFGSTRLVVVSL